MTDFRWIRVEIGDRRVATLTLDDPRRRNALSLPMVEEISVAMDALEADDGVGALVVTGHPPAFCAGADLSHLEEAAESGLRAIYEGFLRIARSSLPTVAAVHGAAVGAGVNLALACDLRLASPATRFDSRFLELGLHPGGGHTWMLQRLGGPQLAAALVVFGEVLDGAEAERVGLVWRTVAEDELQDRARDLAARAAAAPPELLATVRRTLRATAVLDRHEDAVEAELGPQVWSLEQPFFAERMEAIRRRIRSRARRDGGSGEGSGGDDTRAEGGSSTGTNVDVED